MFHYIRPLHHPLRYSAGLSSITAGILHATIVAYLHWTPFPPLETTFFISTGVFQVVVGILFFFSPALSTYRIGLLLNGGIAALYISLRFLPVPFMGAPEGFDAIGLIVLIAEIISVKASLVWLLTHDEHSQKTNPLLALSSAYATILIGALGFYGSAKAMEIAFPDRSVTHDHGHAHVHEGHGAIMDAVLPHADESGETEHNHHEHGHPENGVNCTDSTDSPGFCEVVPPA